LRHFDRYRKKIKQCGKLAVQKIENEDFLEGAKTENQKFAA